MPAKNKPCTESLITMLDEEMATFGEVPYPLLSCQLEAFQTYHDMLREDEESLEKLSKQRRCERTRVCDLLADIFVAVGAEVFLLTVFAASKTFLSQMKPKSCIPPLREWWGATTSRPRALELAVRQVCETHRVDALISSWRERKISNVESARGQCSLPAWGIGAQPCGAGRVGDTIAEREQRCLHGNAPQCTPGKECSEERAAITDNHIDDGLALSDGDLEGKETRSHDVGITLDCSSDTATTMQGGSRKRRCSEDEARPSMRFMLGSGHILSISTLPENGQYCSFKVTNHRMIEEVPEPLRSGIKTSKLWKEEREGGGLEVTNCLTMILPEQAKEDAFLVIRLGYNEGFDTLNSLGLGDLGVVSSRKKIKTEQAE